MNRPLPTPPKRRDLVETFNALSLAGKEDKDSDKKLPDPPVISPDSDYESSFIGGFRPELLAVKAALDNYRRLSDMTPAVNPTAAAPMQPPKTSSRPPVTSMPAPQQSSTTPTQPPSTPPRPPVTSMPIPQPPKQSSTVQHPLKPMSPHTPARPEPAPSSVTPPSRPHPDSLPLPPAMAQPSISASGRPSHAELNATPTRPRASSIPPSSTTSSPGSTTAQCSGTTKAGRQCTRRIKIPRVHSLLNPDVPALYCHSHKQTITAQTGFYVRRPGHEEKFIEFGDYIPKYLQTDTQLALKVEMEKKPTSSDVSGYIYTFEIRDPKRPNVIQLKVGRTVNLNKRLDQWDKQCQSKVQIPRGWWPGTVEGDEDGPSISLLKGNIKAGEPGPYSHRVERLVHIELADLSLHAPYLEQDWPELDKPHASLSAASTCMSCGSTSSPKKAPTKACPDCGIAHKEIFAFPRPGKGKYKGREWDLIVKPVIEKWGKFVRESYA